MASFQHNHQQVHTNATAGFRTYAELTDIIDSVLKPGIAFYLSIQLLKNSKIYKF